MKFSWILPAATLAAVFTLANCAADHASNDDFDGSGRKLRKGQQPQPQPSRYLVDDTSAQPPSTQDNPLPQTGAVSDSGTTPPIPPAPTQTTTVETSTTTAAPPIPPPPSSPQYPYGKPVPGKKGFVISPYDDKAGMIDVRDYTPGTKVRDPYTNKIFLVP